MGYRGRDVEVAAVNEDQVLVAACDSCGGIGDKEFDEVKISQYIVGRLTTRVALLELIAVGAEPRLLTVTSANEPDPTLKEILKGVNDELNALSLSNMPLVITSEKNIPTKQTGLGISAVGICDNDSLRIGTCEPGDIVFCLGIPKVGQEVFGPDDPEIIQGHDIFSLLNSPGVHDIVPVGSRGILAEAVSMASGQGRNFEAAKELNVDIGKSAGPSTCLIFSCSPDTALTLAATRPLFKIGRIT